MLTKISISNFKAFEHVELELGDRVVFVGPNNSGKSSALQALALWSVGVKRWVEKRGDGDAPQKRPGVTINRRDVIALPIPSADLLWRNLRVREGKKTGEKLRTENVLIDIAVEGFNDGSVWAAAMEFDYANSESFYCRSKIGADGQRKAISPFASGLKIAYLPPMSGLAANETRLDQGAIDVRIGEGRTAEILRNLCWTVSQRTNGDWDRVVEGMKAMFGVTIKEPVYVKERGEIQMSYADLNGVELDLSASGRGQQQTLLLMAHMAANPGSVLLLDEPDAHLEFLRQGQIYQLLTETATKTKCQIIAASHSEKLLNEAADRDLVITFVGKPHRIDDRKSQVLKALKEIGFEHFVQAETRGWVLYLEGSTDLAILRAFAQKLNHPAQKHLASPFVHYVGNQPRRAEAHFYGIREAKPDLIGISVFDRLDSRPPDNAYLTHMMWEKREIENYLCQRKTLIEFARVNAEGTLFELARVRDMDEAITRVTEALRTLGKDPFGPDAKVSEDFLKPVFEQFYTSQNAPNLMRKTDFHVLADCVAHDDLDNEIVAKLDQINNTAERAVGVTN